MFTITVAIKVYNTYCIVNVYYYKYIRHFFRIMYFLKAYYYEIKNIIAIIE